ncbi:CD1E protein, partial [Penelope pileata]|nr:CD1E protein [Penelope pileata]
GSFTIWLLQTSAFQNASFVEMEGLDLLEDIVLGVLEERTWSIHFHQIWVQPALPRSDWHTTENMIKIYLQTFSHLVNKGANPFVVQGMAGCELYLNRTSLAFIYVGYNGQDLLSYDIDRDIWLLNRDNNLSRYVQGTFQNYTAINELLQVLFNDTCVDDLEVFLQYGKAALVRQEQPVATVFAHVLGPAQLQLICHVTTYPRSINVFWLQDGQEMLLGPTLSTSLILPKADLTYQLRSVLVVAPGTRHSYTCRVRRCSLGTHSLLVPWG